MSWSNAGNFRNVNPLVRLNHATNGQMITIYQPGILNSATVKPDITYSGLVTNLRVRVNINSLLEEYVIPPQADTTPEEYALLLNNYDANAPKKALNFYLENSTQNPILLIQLYLFKRRPFYIIDALAYFTNTISLDLASDAKITAKTQDMGFGDLLRDDELIIWGCAIEEQENATGTFTINCGSSDSIRPVNLGTVIGYQGQPLAFGGHFANAS